MKTEEDTQKKLINNSVFSFHLIGIGIGDTGAASLGEALKSKAALNALYLSCEDKRKKTHKRPQSANYSYSFSLYQQGTALETQEQRH